MKFAIFIILCGWAFTIVSLNEAERRADQCQVQHSEVFP